MGETWLGKPNLIGITFLDVTFIFKSEGLLISDMIKNSIKTTNVRCV